MYPKDQKAETPHRHWPVNVTAALFKRVKKWKQPKCPSMEEGINTVWSILTMEYYLALKRKDILTQATRGMNLEDTEPHEISQQHKDTQFLTAPVRALEQTNPQTQKGSEVPRGCSRGRGTRGLVGTEFLFGRMRTFWRRMVLMAARQRECT